MSLLRLVFWDDENIKLVSGHSFEDVKGKLYSAGLQVPVEYLATRRTLREYFEGVTGKSVSISRAVFPFGLFWFDKGFRSFTLPDGRVVRMVRVSACIANSLRGDGSVLDDLETVSAFRENRFDLFDGFSDSELLEHVRGSVCAESVSNVFLIDSTVLPR